MKRKSPAGPHLIVLIASFILALSACSPGESAQTATLTQTSTNPTSETPTLTYTPTITRTPTQTRTPTPTNTRTPRPTRTYTAAPSRTPTTVPAGTLTPTSPQSESGPFSAVLTLYYLSPGLVQQLFLLNDHTAVLGGTFGIIKINLDSGVTELTRGYGELLGLGPQGRMWVLPKDGSTISAWDGQSWQDYGYRQGWLLAAQMEQSPLPTPALQIDPQGDLWLATAVDLRRFDGQYWHVITATESGISLPYKAGVSTSIVFDIDPTGGDVWEGSCNWQEQTPISGGGLRVYHDRHWSDPGFPAASDCISGIKVRPDGSVWVAAGASLWLFDPLNSTWTEYPPPDPPDPGMHYLYTEEIVMDPEGSLWPLTDLTDSSGMVRQKIRYKLQDDRWKIVRRLDGLTTQQLLFLPSGKVWTLEPGIVLAWNKAESWNQLATLDFRAATQAPDGSVWLITSVKENPILWRAIP